MKLYYTPNSPYARITRIAARYGGFLPRLSEIAAETRAVGSPYFEVTPLARVPYLEDGAVRLGDTLEICRYFDHLSGQRRWFPEQENLFAQHVIRGFLDGVAVWLRENGRPAQTRSDEVMRYEVHRAAHILGWLERHYAPAEVLGFSEIALLCAVDIARDRGMAAHWGDPAPKLMGWVSRQVQDAAFEETRPL